MKGERTNFQWLKLFLFFLTLVLTVGSSVLRGSKRMDSIVGIERCSWPDWTIYAIYFLLVAGITLFSAVYLKALYLRKVKHEYEFKKGDLKWTIPKLILLVTIAFMTGLVSGALGLGGGVIFNPLFLELGLHP